MGHIFSKVEGTEKNYSADLDNYQLIQYDINEIDKIFHNLKTIDSFYENNHAHNLESLWHCFCYKHKLIINKIRFESFQILYNRKFNIRYEIGFNGLWHLKNNNKIPIQCFKLEKTNNKSNKANVLSHSDCYIYIALKQKMNRIADIIKYLNQQYSFENNGNDGYEQINIYIMDILCSYLPSNHIFNYNGAQSFKLCEFTSIVDDIHNNWNENDSEITESIAEICKLTKNKEKFIQIINLNAVKLMMFDYDIDEDELLQFIKYLLLFYYHKQVNKWIKQKCNYESNKYMNNALIEVTNIWQNSYKNYKYIKVQ